MEPATTAALVGGAASVIGAGTSAAAQANLNKKNRAFNAEQAQIQREWSEQMYNKQNAWNYEMWQQQNEYNSPVNQVQRLRDAGLNPLFYGLDGSSAQSVTAAQPLGYERASMDNQPNPLGSLSKGLSDAASLYLQGKSVSKDIELKNAEIDRLKQESSGLRLDNEFKEKTMGARVQSEELKNQLSKKNMAEIDSRIKKNEQDIKESIARTENEIEKKGFILAETTLRKAQTSEIVQLIPYKKLLIEAQTDAQQAAAASSYMNALYQFDLIDSGYIDSLVGDLQASIRQKNAQADSAAVVKALNEWKIAVKNGNAFDPSTIPWYRFGDKVAVEICNELFKFTSAASEAVGSGLSGLLK